MAARGRRRRRVALIVSLVVHAALLSPLLLVAPPLPWAPSPRRGDLLLDLVPEAGLGADQRRTHSTSAQGQPVRTPATLKAPARPTTPSAVSSAPSETHVPPSVAAAPSGERSLAPAATDAGGQAAMRRALQAALACAPGASQNLDDEGRAACRKRLSDAGVAMGEAKVDTIPPEKRAYYDAVQKAYQDIRHYGTPDSTLTRLDGAQGMYDVKVMNMPGRLPMAGCGTKFGGPKGAKTADAPAHSLHFKLGPLVCALAPPQGVLTEESATPDADNVP